MNNIFKLFGSIIHVRPTAEESVGHSTAPKNPSNEESQQAEESARRSTAPENPSDEESVVLSPEPLRMYIPYKIRRGRREALMPESNLSAEFLQSISPARPVFLYRKKLTMTDVDEHQNRLLVTDTERLNEFLTKEERQMAEVDVIAVDMNGTEFNLKLAKRGERKISVVLRKKWCSMVRANGVEALDFVDVWGFRRGPELRMAVVFTRR